jgi:hypothetical protein
VKEEMQDPELLFQRYAHDARLGLGITRGLIPESVVDPPHEHTIAARVSRHLWAPADLRKILREDDAIKDPQGKPDRPQRRYK